MISKFDSKFFYFILIFILFWAFRLNSLGFELNNNDSTRWMYRSEAFLQAVKSGNFSETNQKYHPGVTLMIINSVTRQAYYFLSSKFGLERVNLMAPENFGNTNFWFKFTLLIVIFLVICVQINIIAKLWNLNVALWYFFILSVEPYFIGINRWFHLTSLEVVFGFTSILFILAWNKFKDSKYFVLSAIFLALGVLTKVTTIVLGVVILFVLVKNYLETKKISNFIFYFLIYLGSIFVLFPALWAEPFKVSNYILTNIFGAVSDTIRNSKLEGLVLYFYYPLILLLKLSPVTLVLVLGAILNFKKYSKDFNYLFVAITFAVYFIFLTLSEQKIDRYSLVFYEPLFLICALFVSNQKSLFKKIYAISAVLFIAFVHFWYSESYSAFYSPIFGGTNTALELGVYENGGNFYSNSAEFLNKNFPNHIVLVPNNFEAFSFFYKGKTITDSKLNFDFVISSLDIDRLSFENYGCDAEIASFGPVDQKVVKVFKCQ